MSVARARCCWRWWVGASIDILIAEAWAWNGVETIGTHGAWPSGIVCTDWWCIDDAQGRRTRHGRVRRTLAEGMMWSNMVDSEAAVTLYGDSMQWLQPYAVDNSCTMELVRKYRQNHKWR